MAEERRRLVLRAPCDGYVLPPPITPLRKTRTDRCPPGMARRWNRSTCTPISSKACSSARSAIQRLLEAVLVIDQADRPFVREGQAVDLKLDSHPLDTLHGSIVGELSMEDLRVVSRRMSAKAQGELATKTDPVTGVERPMSTSYQAHVPLDNPDGSLLMGFRGRARIHSEWQTLGKRCWRFLTRTFNFRL